MNKPRRIVSLISSATEILHLLGEGARVVGVSHECDYPAEVHEKPRLTRSLVESAAASRAIDDQVRALSQEQRALYEIDVQKLAELKPDLIITQAQCDVCAVRYEDVVSAVRETPELAGAEILALNPHSLGDVLDDVRRVAQAIGSARGDTVRAELEQRIETVRARTSALPSAEIPRVACLEWIDPPMLAANWTPELVALAGGQPGLVEAGRHSGYADWRQIVAYDPQVIVVMPCGFDLERAIVEAQVLPGFDEWSELAAVRAGRVFAVDGNAYFNRSGPRLVDSLEILAHLFHPNLDIKLPALARRAWRRLETRGRSLVGATA